MSGTTPGREPGITAGGMVLDTSDPWEAITILAAKRDDLRALVAEIRSHFGPMGTGQRGALVPDALMANWEERAGIEDDQP